MINIPERGILTQTNRSDVIGDLWASKGIDLTSNLGVLRAAPRLKIITKTGDSNATNMGLPVAFKVKAGRVIAIAGSRVIVSSAGSADINSVFIEDTSTGAATDYDASYSDLELFNDVAVSSSTAKIRTLDSIGGTWTDRKSISGNSLKKLCYFKKTNRMYFSQNDSFVNSMNTSYTVADSGDYTLDWTTRISLLDLKATSEYMWIAGKGDNVTRDECGVVWQWDGVTPQIKREFKIPGTGAVVAIVIDKINDKPMAMGDNGILYEFNGNGFTEVGRLPYTLQRPYQGANAYASAVTADRFIHPNGIVQNKDGSILALVNNLNNDNGATINENLPSGIWEWTKDTGFYHKYPITYDPNSSSITDYGQNRVSRVGAIGLVDIPSTNSGRNGSFFCGVTYYTDASSTNSAVFFDDSNDTIQKYAYIVTKKIKSRAGLIDTWARITQRFDRLPASGDRIDLKYRTFETSPIEATITWASTSSFTSTGSLSTFAAGDEVEVIQGKGSGKCAHIATIVNNAGTYTVTLDDTFTGVGTSGTAKARFQKWIKISSVSSLLEQVKSVNTALSTFWIQLKVCMQFTGKGEWHDIIIDNISKVDPLR